MRPARPEVRTAWDAPVGGRQDLGLGSLFSKRASGLDYPTCQELQAFICQIEALKDRARDLARVDELLALAHEVLASIRCPEDFARCPVLK